MMSIRLLLLHAGVPEGVLSHGHMELKFAKIYKRCFWSVLRLSSLSSTSFCWKNKRANLPVSWRICEMFSVIKLRAEESRITHLVTIYMRWREGSSRASAIAITLRDPLEFLPTSREETNSGKQLRWLK